VVERLPAPWERLAVFAQAIEEMMGGIDESQKALISGGNAARVWGLDD
jgi:hypothetical protein